MTKTTNYQLNQWEKSDRILMEEFNDNWDKIDTAMLGKKLLLDYTTEEEALTVEVPLTGVDWGSCAAAVIKIIPSETQASPDNLWLDFDSLTGTCRSLCNDKKYNYFAPASLSGKSLIFLFTDYSSSLGVAGITAHGCEVYACSNSERLSNKKALKLTNRNSGKTAAGTRVQSWGLS